MGTLRDECLIALGSVADKLREEGVLSADYISRLEDRLTQELDKAYLRAATRSAEQNELSIYIIQDVNIRDFDTTHILTHPIPYSAEEFYRLIEGYKEHQTELALEGLLEWLEEIKGFKYVGTDNVTALPFAVSNVIIYAYE